mmetsp:Transcript_4954/g.14258  ORF Transcript_4954/g.14258 Transcript_4954/m.14258 type:complete len:676 (-) Transcript_4954:710-2737(-)|eukprot:CAMPEP_0206141864 /NCGR_PEP_ID=MMETSP1473-20131121/14443_1 /ASSEMBLY_ACC=CAM_ASM_001109 /TAXON_ID=1461547 /ORGANISM="Stichococcus sp, Strain RCC1054" /LENGTH=675 /DNA_ID=CAMNT_0053536599 /DNA_START=834 /DNA_END=2861 /DNA_ORIENTATION=-
MNAWSLAVAVVTVVVVLYLVIAEPAVEVPAHWLRRPRPLRVSVSYGYAPIVGVLVLLAAGAATGETIKAGIVGTGEFHPYGIVILFMSQAYLCVSLDHTGVFAYIAAHVTRRAGTGGHKVFAAYFILASALTVLTSNDVVILTITPIVCHFARVTKTDPSPLLFNEFFAANVWGMTLLIGNPTNIIIGESVNLSFLNFSKWSILPTLVAGAATYVALLAIFRRSIGDAPPLEGDLDPSSLLVDPWGAKFGFAVLLLSLVMLAIANFIGAPLWAITLAAAAVLVAGNWYVHYLNPWFQQRRHSSRDTPGRTQPAGPRPPGTAAVDSAAIAGGAAGDEQTDGHQPAIEMVIVQPEGNCDLGDLPPSGQLKPASGIHLTGKAQRSTGNGQCTTDNEPTHAVGGCAKAVGGQHLRPVDGDSLLQNAHSSAPAEDIHLTNSLRRRTSAGSRNGSRASSDACSGGAIKGGSFIGGSGGSAAKGGFGISGADDLDAIADAAAAEHNGASADDTSGHQAGFSLWRTFQELPWHVVPFLFGMFILVEALALGGWVDYFARALAGATSSTFAAVFLTGAIGSVLANIVNNQPMTILMARILLSEAYKVSDEQRRAANLSLIAASNVGANFSLIGSLAAVMWIKLLKAKEVPMPFWRFTRVALCAMPVPLVLCLLAFWGEVMVFPP